MLIKDDMWYYIIKILISAAIITLVSEVAKRNNFIASLIASLPLVSVLALIWLYNDTKDIRKVSDLSYGIFWLVIPSLSLFLLLPVFIKYMNFYFALLLSIILMIALYFLMEFILEKFGIKI